MYLVLMYGLLTIFCVIYGIRKQKIAFLILPFASLFVYIIIKIIMVPMPFWETVQFIIGLR